MKESEEHKNYIKDRYHYNPLTGDLWIKLKTFCRVCDSVHDTGCLQINILKTNYKAHRVCWFLYYGEFSKKQIDHIDGNRLNNKIENLREATKQQNMRNRGKQLNNTSGFKGVGKHYNKWIANITVNRKTIYIGLYSTPEEASAAYQKKAAELFGSFNPKL